MSVTEAPAYDTWGDGPAPYEPGEAPRGENDRTPPQDMAAEQCVLGAMLISKDAIANVTEELKGSDFYRPSHEAIYDAITDLYGRGDAVDMITVKNELERQGELQRIGGAAYLHTLAANVPIAANAPYYAQIVRDKAVLRRLVTAGTKIVQTGYAGEGEVDMIVDAAEAEIFGVKDKRRTEDYAPLGDFMDKVLEEIEALSNREQGTYGVPTGFADLDELTNGFQPGQMIIVAARPAMGKSTLALDFCRSASIANNMTSVFFSLEMTRSEIAMRMLAAEARVPLGHIRGGQMAEDDWTKLASKMGKVSGAPLFIDDSPNMTMMEIRSKARRLKQRHDLRLVVIDYMQLMSSGKKVESRQLEVSEFSRQIKLLAKELEVPIIALSQLNRGPEQRADKRPMPSDLRESGSLEQDADMVILLHREDHYEKESSRPGEADLIVAKNRNGPTRDVIVTFQGHYSRFADMAR
ncbi:replicative DNA helicase [Nocardioides baekrokdamisoli]|uniref:Replicative DNA helicase n=1 Tax=Nocardioides baekrokdamisoli TaxID=1804624 RepID=A0A3G9IN10_9ACTN|nr:replicative DNA helicase [Nocardioides baekrokdamisoli]BBH17415.1 replicative DNA helicase [Nocardioides baekrokdamisoli]